MVVRLKRIHRHFLLLIGLFLFLSLALNLLPEYFTVENGVFSTVSSSALEQHNKVRNISGVHRIFKSFKSKSIWKIEQGDDRIEAQIAFRPNIDFISLPAKTILLQSGVYSWGVQAGQQQFITDKCLVNNCLLEEGPVDGKVYDARLFKEIEINQFLLPRFLTETPRHPDQVWILFGLESPEVTPSYEQLNHVINWTATYRWDSTIVAPYDKWVRFDNISSLSKPKKNYADGKTKLAAIFVSNCQAANNRMAQVEELKQFIDLHVYGFCGDKVCDKGSQQECFEMLRTDYKFYLSFENANCREYITEKLFLNALRYDVIPVVMGAHPADYARAAPPGSFIHVEEFNSTKALADYLLKLDGDDDMYNSYFRWKDAGQFLDTKFWCRICSMLWDPDKPRISVPDLDNWWRGGQTCIGRRKWKDIR